MENTFGSPSAMELADINQFTRRELSAEDVYVFSVVLCDNDIDRDYECFSDEALEKLSELFVGVTGIADHDPKSSNQSARIFSCHTEAVSGRLTADGRHYRRLCARAYLPRSEKNDELILSLDSGIKKEVSVGCAVRHRTCSICGEEISECQHIRGRSYGGKTCCAVLSEVTDAYEWSFVAVPAQRSAGVVKGYDRQAPETVFKKSVTTKENGGCAELEIEKKLFSDTEQQFSAMELKELAESFRKLQKNAADGVMYRDKLMKEIHCLSSMVLPELKAETLTKMAEVLNVRQLDELKSVFEKKAADILPVTPQLFKRNKTTADNNANYQNI